MNFSYEKFCSGELVAIVDAADYNKTTIAVAIALIDHEENDAMYSQRCIILENGEIKNVSIYSVISLHHFIKL